MSETKVAAPRLATPGDARSLTRLINRAFEVEADFVRGSRISVGEVEKLIEHGSLWMVEDEQGVLACVKLELLDERRGRFGLLAVDPRAQSGGMGRRLMTFAESWIGDKGCSSVEILVVDLRIRLRAWYESNGYRTIGSLTFSQPERLLRPCRFLVMRKELD